MPFRLVLHECIFFECIQCQMIFGVGNFPLTLKGLQNLQYKYFSCMFAVLVLFAFLPILIPVTTNFETSFTK